MASPITPIAQCILDALRDAALQAQPAPTKRELSDGFDVSIVTVKQTIDTLLERGLIKRELSPGGNQRRFYVASVRTWTDFSVPAKVSKKKTQSRECITGCGRSFQSEGPHHRMCKPCRQFAAAHQGGTIGRVVPLRRGAM